MSDTADTTQRTLDLTRIPTLRTTLRRALLGGAIGGIIAAALLGWGIVDAGSGEARPLDAVRDIVLFSVVAVAMAASIGASAATLAPFLARAAYADADAEYDIARAIGGADLGPRRERLAPFVAERERRSAQGAIFQAVLRACVFGTFALALLVGGVEDVLDILGWFGGVIALITGLELVLRISRLRAVQVFAAAHPLPVEGGGAQ